MGDLLLHETGVSWFRKRMREEKPVVKPWLETYEQWAERARRAVQGINADYDVRGVVQAIPRALGKVRCQGRRPLAHLNFHLSEDCHRC